jgi:hypothetical protein
MSPLTPLSKKARAAEEQRIRVCKLVIGLGDLGSAGWGQLDHTDWRNLILAVEVRLPFFVDSYNLANFYVIINWANYYMGHTRVAPSYESFYATRYNGFEDLYNNTVLQEQYARALETSDVSESTRVTEWPPRTESYESPRWAYELLTPTSVAQNCRRRAPPSHHIERRADRLTARGDSAPKPLSALKQRRLRSTPKYESSTSIYFLSARGE